MVAPWENYACVHNLWVIAQFDLKFTYIKQWTLDHIWRHTNSHLRLFSDFIYLFFFYGNNILIYNFDIIAIIISYLLSIRESRNSSAKKIFLYLVPLRTIALQWFYLFYTSTFQSRSRLQSVIKDKEDHSRSCAHD